MLWTLESPVSSGAERLREGEMITIGVDAHKRIHVAVAVDDAGRELGQWRGANSAEWWATLYR